MKTYRVEKEITLHVSAEGSGKDWYWSFLNWEGLGADEMDAIANSNGDEFIIWDAVVTRDGDDFLIQGCTECSGDGEACEVWIDKSLVTFDYNYGCRDSTFLQELGD